MAAHHTLPAALSITASAARVQVVEVESHYTVMQDEQAANVIRELLDRRVDLRAP